MYNINTTNNRWQYLQRMRTSHMRISRKNASVKALNSPTSDLNVLDDSFPTPEVKTSLKLSKDV